MAAAMSEWWREGDPGLDPASDAAVARRWVEAVPVGDDAFEQHRRRILDLISEHDERAAVRTTRPGHLTGSAFVVDATGEHVVLLLHRKLRRWLQPGGHADGDTNLAAVAWREASEETGIAGLEVLAAPVDLDVHEVRPPAEDPHLHLDVRFVVRAPAHALLVANEESDDLRWVSRADLDRFDLDAGLRRLAARSFALLDVSSD
jgi:8-oxo-dGTP pyrophosphatase MutT (NUDIX family)